MITRGQVRRRRRAVAGVGPAALLAVLLGGCGYHASLPTPTTTPADAEGDAATASPASPGAPASASPAARPPQVVLEGGGLDVLGGDLALAALPFATTPGATVRAAVQAALGAVTDVPLPSCPQGPRTALQADGLTLLVGGDRFVGWSDDGTGEQPRTTDEGVGAGSSLADLRSAAPGLQLLPPGPDGLVPFTSTGGLSGHVDGGQDASLVVDLSAGETCAVP